MGIPFGVSWTIANANTRVCEGTAQVDDDEGIRWEVIAISGVLLNNLLTTDSLWFRLI